MTTADGFSLVLIVLMAIGGLVGWVARQESQAIRGKRQSRKSSWPKGQQ
jgi:predicted negative regulator of RcsB-dependent stress response